MRGLIAKSRHLLLIGLAALVAGHTTWAQPVDVPSTWGGGWDTRPRLTGSWGGARDELGKKGIVLDVDLLLTPQDVFSGGRSTGGEFWGNGEYTLNIDTQKAGWWPGGFFKVQGITGFGTNIYQKSGAIIPPNTAALFPGNNEHTTALTNATYMQFLSETFGVVFGKLNTIDLGAQEFYGNYHTQFMNGAFNFPTTLAQIPISSWGGGLIALPTKDLTLSVLALNPDGTPTSNQVFGSSVEVVGNGSLAIRPYGLLGHQIVGVSWNDKKRYSLEQDPSNIFKMLLFSNFPRLANPGPELTAILEQCCPQLLTPVVPANTKSSSWAFSYSFDQYLYQPDKSLDQGIGVFFGFGASDGNPNPIKYSFLIGVGGKGVVPGRPADSFGIGFANTQFSNALLPFLREKLALGLGHENAFEAYYNVAITGWLDLTADIQVINPGLDKTLSGKRLVDVSNPVIGGLRLRARF